MTDNSYIIPRKSLGEEVADRLREEIINGHYQEDDWIKEDAIVKRYQVSRTPVREALTILEKEGLVSSVPYKGKKVNKYSQTQIYEIYLIQSALEEVIVSSVCPDLKAEDFKQLELIVDQLEAYVDTQNAKESKKYHNEFHFYFIDRCKFQRIVEIVYKQYHTCRTETIYNPDSIGR